MGHNVLVLTREALELAADIREKLRDYKPPEPEPEEVEQEEPEMTATASAFAYHATVNLKVHLSHQVCKVEGGETYKSIDSKMVARAVEVALEALQGQAAGELPHLRLYLHGCMVTADIDECQWLEEVPEPLRPKRCESEGCNNGINYLVANNFTPFCSQACQERDED